jgi:hypothetical protein
LQITSDKLCVTKSNGSPAICTTSDALIRSLARHLHHQRRADQILANA